MRTLLGRHRRLSTTRSVLSQVASSTGSGDIPSLDLDFSQGILDPRITFTRSTVGTYYRGQFNQNRQRQSENIVNLLSPLVWASNGFGADLIRPSGVSPTGTNTASLLQEDSSNGRHDLVGYDNGVAFEFGGLQATFSVYVKAAGRNWVKLSLGAGGVFVGAYFDLTNVAVGTVDSGFTAQISDAGNGWRRCAITTTSAAGTVYTRIRLASVNGTDSYQGNGVSGVLIWGAQLTEGSLLIPYIPTTTAAITQGQIASSQPWNQILRSQEFNVTWTLANITVTADATAAPDGTTTADKVIANTTNGNHSIYQAVAVVSGVTYTHSVFAKASEYTKFRMIPQGTATIATTEYDLSTGTSTLVSGTATHSITDVGNGWYRCSVTFAATGTGTGYIQMNLVNAAGLQSFAGDATSGTFFWGAQVNEGTSALEYSPTTAVSNWLPRFENDPVTGEARGLLIEGGATNLCLQSAAVRTSPWVVLQLTAAGSSITAPDGTASGTEVVVNNGITTGNGYLYQDITAAASTTYTASVYFKAKGTALNTRFECDALNASNVNVGTLGVTFTHSSGTIGTVSATGWTSQSGTVTNVGNGWYRVTITGTSPATTAKIRWFMYATGTGNGTDGVYIWGTQLEAQSFASSYIPTTTASVARGADSAAMTGTNFSSWYNQSEGTIYADQQVYAMVANSAAIALYQGSSTYCEMGQGVASTAVDMSRFYARIAGVDDAVLTRTLTGLAVGNNIKSAVAYKTNDVAFSANANAVLADATFTPQTPTEMYIGRMVAVSNRSVLLRRIAYWPTRLPNATLQSLTT